MEIYILTPTMFLKEKIKTFIWRNQRSQDNNIEYWLNLPTYH